MKLLHKYHIPLHVFTFAVTALAIIMVVSPFVRATGEYQASDMLGHLPVNYVPTFTQGTPDSNLPIAAPSTNRFGLHDPTATALDPVNHLLYVADIQNNRVLVYQLNGANRQTSLNATYVLGQPNMLSSTQATTQSGMDSPRAIAVDTANQRVFVVEYDNNRVLVYDTSGGITNGMNASYVLGQADFTSNGQGAGQTGFTTPRGVGYDPVNELVFVADTGNHRVLVYDARDSGSPDRTLCGTTTNGIANGMNASCVFGQPDFATTSFGTSINKMYFPRGISFSSVDGGTKKQASSLVAAAATSCGMPFVNKRWLGGTLTNFASMAQLIRRYKDMKRRQEKGEHAKYTKFEQLKITEQIALLDEKVIGCVVDKKWIELSR
jgi:hypothetical protein